MREVAHAERQAVGSSFPDPATGRVADAGMWRLKGFAAPLYVTVGTMWLLVSPAILVMVLPRLPIAGLRPRWAVQKRLGAPR